MLRNLITLAFFLTLPSVSFAQERAPAGPCPSTSAWQENIGAQMERLLTSPDAHRRAETLELLLALDRRGCALPEGPVTEAVLDVYRHDVLESHRIMAAVVLEATGSPYAQEQMRAFVPELDSDTVRRVTLGILAQAQAETE